MKEIFWSVKDFEEYQISNYGNVLNLQFQRQEGFIPAFVFLFKIFEFKIKTSFTQNSQISRTTFYTKS